MAGSWTRGVDARSEARGRKGFAAEERRGERWESGVSEMRDSLYELGRSWVVLDGKRIGNTLGILFYLYFFIFFGGVPA